jgi:6-pyruvoyltetrahydropterin/6-carboxytetrahydropterin synthase
LTVVKKAYFTWRSGTRDLVFEVGAAVEVRAFHVMPGAPGPEGTLHSHDYRLEVVVRRSELDDRGMVCDLDVVNDALANAAALVRDVNLEIIRPRDTEAVTVEVFSRWLHDALAEPVRAAGGETLAVRVWESPDAFGGYCADVKGPARDKTRDTVVRNAPR